MSEANVSSTDCKENKTKNIKPPITEDDAPKVLTKEEGLREGITPVGRQAELYRTGSLWGWRLQGVGPQPLEASELYTGEKRCQAALDSYLNRFWSQVKKRNVSTTS